MKISYLCTVVQLVRIGNKVRKNIQIQSKVNKLSPHRVLFDFPATINIKVFNRGNLTKYANVYVYAEHSDELLLKKVLKDSNSTFCSKILSASFFLCKPVDNAAIKINSL